MTRVRGRHSSGCVDGRGTRGGNAQTGTGCLCPSGRKVVRPKPREVRRGLDMARSAGMEPCQELADRAVRVRGTQIGLAWGARRSMPCHSAAGRVGLRAPRGLSCVVQERVSDMDSQGGEKNRHQPQNGTELEGNPLAAHAQLRGKPQYYFVITGKYTARGLACQARMPPGRLSRLASPRSPVTIPVSPLNPCAD